MLDVRARTNAIPHDWAEWEVKDDHELRLIQASGAVRSARCQTLATFEPARQRFTWQCGAPLFDEALYTLPTFPCTWEGAYEVGGPPDAVPATGRPGVRPREPRPCTRGSAVPGR